MISDLIEEIIETGSQGKELIKDAFIIGIAWGRKQLHTFADLKSAIKSILKVNEQIDKSLVTPFYKEDKYNNFLVDNVMIDLYKEFCIILQTSQIKTMLDNAFIKEGARQFVTTQQLNFGFSTKSIESLKLKNVLIVQLCY
ncbi:unnamed protein product (macronuclear) [Paramecium tetraurelia]|uniref:Uncharacterized protein n=1 Tax=Paramecium tetraurelia TaxID=5888 RepID=A0BTT1_PARTE|nr:uncharacterized protein GSPATT00032180001 [Paramecium tetraurelia]CAK61948.1 unnamed protein product [Paramecium tetraurelia]|eukprot:XP_001429346.1 hypothetical protein (macronuclear) [Paramecium tetraurelia strain d4-2]